VIVFGGELIFVTLTGNRSHLFIQMS